MSAITFTVEKRSGDHVKAAVGPSNRSEETHFGPIDYLIVGFFLLSVGGFVLLLTLN
jgi:hypothetical protein